MAATESLLSQSAEETVAFGQSFAHSLGAGDVVALFGEMGSGKTTFVNGVSTGLRCTGIVSNPTFTLINEYEGDVPIYHFDFFRIASCEEAWHLGCEDYFGGDGICLIEWSEHILDLLPPDRIEVHFRWFQESDSLNQREIMVHRK